MTALRNCLIIIGTNLPYNYPTDYVKQTAKILSKNNHVIVISWQNPLSLKEILLQRKKQHIIIPVTKKTILFNPLNFLPFKRFALIQKLNLRINSIILKIWIKLFLKKPSTGFKSKILWLFSPCLYELPKVMGNGYKSLYDCVESYTWQDKEKNIIARKQQNWLIKNVNYFFVNSVALAKKYQAFGPIVVPQGFDLKTFKKYGLNNYSSLGSLPSLTRGQTVKKPIIGYVGGINYRLDYQLLIKLAYANPTYSFVFVGSMQEHLGEDALFKTDYYINKLFSLSNVYHIQQQPKHKLPHLISEFDVCLIPYNSQSDFNRYCYPMKIFEYFYLGKPVIATNIPSLYPLRPYVIIANRFAEFNRKLKQNINYCWPQKYVKQQQKFARENSWDKKIEVIYNNIKEN